MTGCGFRRSLRRCLEASVGLGGGVPAEGLAWPCVEFGGDAVEGALVVVGEARAFGEVLADEADGAFGGAALPGPARVTEVDLDAGVDGEADVVGEFFVWSPVSERRRWAGSLWMAVLSAARTLGAVLSRSANRIV